MLLCSVPVYIKVREKLYEKDTTNEGLHTHKFVKSKLNPRYAQERNRGSKSVSEKICLQECNMYKYKLCSFVKTKITKFHVV